jgi:hypothetical protein
MKHNVAGCRFALDSVSPVICIDIGSQSLVLAVGELKRLVNSSFEMPECLFCKIPMECCGLLDLSCQKSRNIYDMSGRVVDDK